MPLLIALLKGLGPTLLGTASAAKGMADSAAETSIAAAPGPPALLSSEMQARFQKLCETYFSTLAKRIVKDYTVRVAEPACATLSHPLVSSDCKIRTSATTRPTFARARSSRTGSRATSA